MDRRWRWVMGVGCATLAFVGAACGDDDESATAVHTAEELTGALLTIEDVSFIPADWEENARGVVERPAPPYEGTLDPYLCAEAGTPALLTMPQAQLELTGGSVMEVLVATEDAERLYEELDAAYQACGADSSLPYEPLSGVPSPGDAAASYRSDLGVVTIARFGTDVMILKWWVGEYYDEAESYYPDLVTVAADRVGRL
jgi:hypothetical protein